MSRLVLMGSGETAPTMVRVHRRVMGESGPGPAVLMDTPFAFQANADDLVQKTRDYFAESVGHPVEVASWRRRDVPAVVQERALALLRNAGWAFAGPGSPSYALRQWSDTPVPRALTDIARRGGTVCVGSAAAVLAGSHAIPVYEIYKAGEDPYWLDGIDLLGTLAGIPAAVIPHFDNNEGGHYDTRFCYLGESRLELLEQRLPTGTGILGVDEHTAVVLDLARGVAEVLGSGGLTLRAAGRSWRFTDGAVLPLTEVAALLRGDAAPAEDTDEGLAAAHLSARLHERSDAVGGGDVVVSLRQVADDAEAAFAQALVARDADAAVSAALELEQALRDWASDTQQGDDEHARRVLRGMIVRLGEAAEKGVRDPRSVVAPFVDALVAVRARARETRDFGTSDLVRDQLAAAGVEVRDTPEGTTWHLNPGI